ncbi:sodium:proton antiporter [Chryseobacterium cucumeris]|uniref:Sodium:proton antiporter n=1 Tax=Chryseobacterium cucumeris TaxID=1813611 RepID=A0ABX9XDY9_9FLAO|nr:MULTISPECIES: sodium:proton antiporter [Chryseobacterium]MPS66707.1 sodium:proton antiporter [Chryseobacterium sp.]PZU08114.1 MAG: sodium:proton antiporter [Chryseobacterium sp.]ROH96604.1 sodium:proton antiporter [Chryseobacterium cucumeris]
MELFLIFSVLITLAAFFSYLNIKFLKLPSGISLMMMGVFAAAGVIVTGYFSSGFTEMIREKLALIDFSEFLLGILLSFLLFAGSLHVSIPELKKSAKSIISFATIGTLISTLVVGYSLFYLLSAFHQDIPLIYCLLFGALISPTDPIAVMGILKKTNLSKNIETNIVGESLFNDGIGVVIFVTILKIATLGPENFGPADIGILFIHEAIGGVIIGLVIGFIGYKLMKSIDHFQTEILISLAMVMGGYSLCHSIHVSGPLAMVVAGLMTGNRGKELAMSDITRDYLGKFWEVTDEVLNAILFMLIGLEIVIVSFDMSYLAIGIITAIIILIARFVSLYVPAVLFRFKRVFGTKSLFIMTWGGLRGGISIALALSLPQNPYKDILVSITFVVVIFSILVQGITVEKVIKKLTS